jgi:hypothetical protein
MPSVLLSLGTLATVASIGCSHSALRQPGDANSGTANEARTTSPIDASNDPGSTADARSDPGADGDTDGDTDAIDIPDAAADAGCAQLCIAPFTRVGLAGHLDLTGGDAGIIAVDSLQITVCLGTDCADLSHQPWSDSQATQMACGDAGTTCEATVFGIDSSSSSSHIYAYVTLSHNAGPFYSVGGTAMFPTAPPYTTVSRDAQVTIRSAGVTYLDARSNDCTIAMGCCGILPYQSCTLAWN